MGNDVSARLKAVRQMHGLSQRELAKRAGVTNGMISLIEQGRVSPSVASLKKVLDGLPMALAEFFTMDPAGTTQVFYTGAALVALARALARLVAAHRPAGAWRSCTKPTNLARYRIEMLRIPRNGGVVVRCRAKSDARADPLLGRGLLLFLRAVAAPVPHRGRERLRYQRLEPADAFDQEQHPFMAKQGVYLQACGHSRRAPSFHRRSIARPLPART